MPTYSSPILPNVAGLAFGSAAQPWSIFATTGSFQRIVSLTANPSTAGFFSLANADIISWRNSANAANLNLSPSGVAAAPFDADLLTYTGSGFKGSEFVSPNNPARSGVLRLGAADAIAFRNQANTADLSIAHNSDDTISIPTIVTPAISVPLIQPMGTGATALVLEGGAGTATGGNISVLATNGTSNGGSVFLNAGNAGLNNGAVISLGGGNLGTSTGGSIAIQPGTGVVTNGFVNVTGSEFRLQSKVTVYNGIGLAGNGLPSQVTSINLSGQVAPVGAALLYMPTATGWFRVSSYLKITTAGTSPVLGPVTIGYTDGTDSVAQSVIMSCQTQAGIAQATGNAGNTTTSVLSGTLVIYALTGVAITYAIALTGTVGAATYLARLRLEAM